MAKKSHTTEVAIQTTTVRTTDGYNLSVKTFGSRPDAVRGNASQGTSYATGPRPDAVRPAVGWATPSASQGTSYATGPHSGRAIIFLHGFPEFWYGWRKQIPFFEERGYFVVVPDQRGYNDSDKPPKIADYSLRHLASDVATIIETLKLERPVLIGHDWGAAAAWQTAIEYGDRISKLVVLNVPHPRAMVKNLLLNPAQFLRSWYMYFFQLPYLPEKLIEWANYERFAEGLKRTSREGTFSDEDLARYVAAWSKPDAMRSMINWYRAMFRFPDLHHNARVKAETLILWGKKDTFLEANMATDSLAYCDNANVKFFDEATHWLQHEEADAVNDEILKFIS